MGTIRKALCVVGFLVVLGGAYVYAVFWLIRNISDPFSMAGLIPICTMFFGALLVLGIHVLRRIWARMPVMNEDDEDFDQYGA